MGTFPYEKHLGVSLPGTLFHMCKSGQFYPNLTWVIALRSAGIDAKWVVSLWKPTMNPHDIVMEDISSVFFDTIMRLSNMKYLKAQEIILNHQCEERERSTKIFVKRLEVGWMVNHSTASLTIPNIGGCMRILKLGSRRALQVGLMSLQLMLVENGLLFAKVRPPIVAGWIPPTTTCRQPQRPLPWQRVHEAYLTAWSFYSAS